MVRELRESMPDIDVSFGGSVGVYLPRCPYPLHWPGANPRLAPGIFLLIRLFGHNVAVAARR